MRTRQSRQVLNHNPCLRNRIFAILPATMAMVCVSFLAEPSSGQQEGTRSNVGSSTEKKHAEDDVRQSLAWNRTDQYIEPDFEEYFPADDPEAAKRLNEFQASRKLREERPEEYIETVRKGLRSTTQHKTLVLSMLGNTFIWGKDPQNEQAIELMYHAAGADNNDVVHYAMYFGATVVTDRTPNLIRMMMTNHHRFHGEIQRRVLWSFKTVGDQGKTVEMLEQLLHDHENLDEFTLIATAEYYRDLVGKYPPHAERFEQLGKWAIGFSHEEVTADQADGMYQLRDLLGQHLDVDDEDILEYVGRLADGKWVGVALVGGLKFKHELESMLEEEDGFGLVFADRLDEKLFTARRLGEFLKFWDGEVKSFRPKYTLPDPDEVYAWNRTDKYVSPVFHDYFPDDAEAGKRLDELIQSKFELTDISDREYLDLFRQGLRRATSSPNVLFGRMSIALGWPADPYQFEIMFHAAAIDAPNEIRKSAIYYWLGRRDPSTDNMLRLFAEIMSKPQSDWRYGRRNTSKIVWSLAYDEEARKTLARYVEESIIRNEAELDSSSVASLLHIHKQLVGGYPPIPEAIDRRSLRVVMWRREGASTTGDIADYQNSLPDNRWFADGGIRFHRREFNRTSIGIAVVQGTDAFEWLLGELERDKKNSIGFAGPYPQPWDTRNGVPEAADIDAFSERGR